MTLARRLANTGLSLLLICLACTDRRPEEAPAPQVRKSPLVEDVQCLELDESKASRFVALSLNCVDREFPNKPSNVVDGDETVRPPRELTPAFYGCFDWHSAVHGHWAMVRILKRYPGIRETAKIRAALDRHLTPELIRREVEYFTAPRNRTFERPYGWGWLLRLAAELHSFEDPDAKRWYATLKPLATLLADRTKAYLAVLSSPIRAGTHPNTAFALVHMWDYAAEVGDEGFRKAITEAARRFYLDDRNCPAAYEPSGEDFISPCLAEVDIMRRVLKPVEFSTWLDRFLPDPSSAGFESLRTPPEVRDRRDPKIGHLIGLDFQRAWALDGLAAGLPAQETRKDLFSKLSRLHCKAGVDLMFDSGYGGSHWLASFAVYHLTGVGVGVKTTRR